MCSHWLSGGKSPDLQCFPFGGCKHSHLGWFQILPWCQWSGGWGETPSWLSQEPVSSSAPLPLPSSSLRFLSAVPMVRTPTPLHGALPSPFPAGWRSGVYLSLAYDGWQDITKYVFCPRAVTSSPSKVLSQFCLTDSSMFILLSLPIYFVPNYIPNYNVIIIIISYLLSLVIHHDKIPLLYIQKHFYCIFKKTFSTWQSSSAG